MSETLHAATHDRRHDLAIPAGVAGLWAALVVLAYAAEQATGHAHALCLFRRVTDTPCPTCGGTRATLAMLTGRPLAAFTLNPLVAAALLLGAAWIVASLARRRPVAKDLLHDRRAWALGAIALAANWTYLLAAGRV